jgi:hypothetical protein
MVLKRTPRGDGSWELRREAFVARAYTFPADEIAALHNLGQTYEESRTTHDGSLRSWHEIVRFERDGKRWALIQEPMYEYAAEVEILANGEIGEVIPVAPERAYELAKERDPPGVIYG